MDAGNNFKQSVDSKDQNKLDLVGNVIHLDKLRKSGHFHKSYESLVQLFVISYELSKNKVFDLWLYYYRNSYTILGIDMFVPNGGPETLPVYACEKKLIHDERSVEIIRAFLKSDKRLYLTEIRRAAQVLSELNLDMPAAIKILSETKIIDWEQFTKSDNFVLSNDKPSLSSDEFNSALSLREIALLWIYRDSKDQIISNDNANGLAEMYHHTSGQSLRQHYNKLRRRNERTGVEGKNSVLSMIRSMEKVKPFLTISQQRQVDDELDVLNQKI